MMENNLTDKVTCRTCLSLVDKRCTVSVYEVSEIIMLCSSIKIVELDGLPPHICGSCHDMAENAYKFRLLCEQSDRKLRASLIPQPIIEIVLKDDSDSLSERSSMEEPNQFSCKICCKSFPSETHLKQHESRSHNVTYECNECGEVCTNPRYLAKHMSLHLPKKSFLCNTCGKQFTCKSNLIKHEKIHTGLKPFECTVCNKRFIESRDLRGHMITHSTEKSYLCNYCGDKLARKNALRMHIRRKHALCKETPSYKCDLCGKCFTDKTVLNRHKYTHTGEKKHVCNVCHKAFNRRSNLSVHERIHSNLRPFICAICQRGFNQKHVLNTHIEKTHQVNT